MGLIALKMGLLVGPPLRDWFGYGVAGFANVAFIIDTFANQIVGWQPSRAAKTDIVPDALEPALYARRPAQQGGAIHRRDRASY